MQLRYTYRIYPTAGQRIALAQTFGCVRAVWNDCLRARKDAHEQGLPFPKSGDLSKLMITQARQTEARAWLSNAPVGVLQQSLRDLDAAYRNFFDSLSGKRKGAKLGEPQFKSRRDNRQTARYTKSDRWKIVDTGRLRLPKVGEITVKWSRALPSAPTTVTIVKDPSGRYFASFIVETDPAAETMPPTAGDQGIDLGLTHFAIMADGSRVKNPRFLRRAEKKLKREQRRLSRKAKGSTNQDKQRIIVARAHAAVADARKDFHHQLSTRLIRENQTVTVETLSVKALARTRQAKSVHDAGWSAFVNMLEYKAARYGRTLTKVDRTFPSSQLCSACGHRDGPKTLNIRAWTCSECGTWHDRDHNSAKNVKHEGSRIRAAV
ncbi:RNA-guided endonuclease TnpB family protein [Streptomyces sp. NPDC091371]|uniref:RNA-guided endonuclease InsQ/TnpB family protein n=1 Tax=Streptomyces sp. NPDC091371 TaxID=3155303 RepID=UPI00342DD8F0